MHQSGPNALTVSWQARNLKLFPAPKAIHSSEMLKHWDDVTTRTTTLLSTVCIETLLFPCCTASSKWSRMQVSASPWVHGTRPNTSWPFVQSMPCSVVRCDDLFVDINAYYISCQEGKQLNLINVNKFLPVFSNFPPYGSTHLNPFSTFATSVSLQAFGQVNTPDDVQSRNML